MSSNPMLRPAPERAAGPDGPGPDDAVAVAAEATTQLLRSDVRLPSTAHLRALEAAVRLGSFERASNELAITPSAVSKRVAALESLLGVKLLARVGRGVEPTTSGKEYLEQVTVALGLLTRSAYHRRQARPLKHLRVALMPTFARMLVVPRLGEFTALYPDVELELMLSIPYMEIAASGCDLEIRFGRDYDPRACERLLDEPVFPVATPTYLNRVGGVAGPADLAKTQLLRCPLEPWQPWFEAAGLDWREPSRGHCLVDLGMLQDMALNHQGIALARRSLAHEALRDRRLVKVLPIEARPRSAYFVYWNRRQGLDEVRVTFVDWLKRVCAEAAAS